MRVIQTAACASLLINMLMLMVAQVSARKQLLSASFGRCQAECVRSCQQAPVVQDISSGLTAYESADFVGELLTGR